MSDRHANLKYKFGNRKFWAEGYYVPAVGPDEAAAAKHMREQGRAYIARDWPGVKGCGGPFARGPQGRWARCRFGRPATGQSAMRPEHREGRRL